MRRIMPLGALALASLCAACSVIAGLDDHRLAPEANVASSSGTGAGGGVGGVGGVGPSGPVALARSAKPRAIAVDATNVYWVSEGDRRVLAVAKTGGPPVELAVTDPAVPHGIALDIVYVYWTEAPELDDCNVSYAGRVMRVKKTGGMAEELWTTCYTDLPFGIAVDGSTVYWTTQYAGNVYRLKKGDPPDSAVRVASSQWNAWDIAVDQSRIYWSLHSPQAEIRMAELLGAVDQSGDFCGVQAQPNGVALDETFVYWASDAGTVRSLAKDQVGGIPTDLATAQYLPTDVALSAAGVFWTNANDGTIRTVPKRGRAEATVLADQQQDPERLAVDDTGVYWTNFDGGEVMALFAP